MSLYFTLARFQMSPVNQINKQIKLISRSIELFAFILSLSVLHTHAHVKVIFSQQHPSLDEAMPSSNARVREQEE